MAPPLQFILHRRNVDVGIQSQQLNGFQWHSLLHVVQRRKIDVSTTAEVAVIDLNISRHTNDEPHYGWSSNALRYSPSSCF